MRSLVLPWVLGSAVAYQLPHGTILAKRHRAPIASMNFFDEMKKGFEAGMGTSSSSESPPSSSAAPQQEAPPSSSPSFFQQLVDAVSPTPMTEDEEREARLAAGEGVVWSADYSRAWLAKKGMPQGEVSLDEAKQICSELRIPLPEQVQPSAAAEGSPVPDDAQPSAAEDDQKARNTGGDLKTTSEILKPGSGAIAITSGSMATLHATGVVKESGKKFWSTKDDGQQPFTCRYGMGQVIKGWDEGCLGMVVGEERRLIIPAEEGYGAGGFPQWGIPPGATLEFTLECLEVVE